LHRSAGEERLHGCSRSIERARMNLEQMAIKATVNSLVENIHPSVKADVANEIAQELLELTDQLLADCVELLRRLNKE
jgi:hypothetical protein